MKEGYVSCILVEQRTCGFLCPTKTDRRIATSLNAQAIVLSELLYRHLFVGDYPLLQQRL
jgi:hypothetical protein